MTWYIPIALIVAFLLGSAITMVVMSLIFIGSLGDDPLPEIEPQRMSHVQD